MRYLFRHSWLSVFVVLPAAIAALIAAPGAPALANVTGATLTALGPTSFNGTCPTTMTFQATISGTKNTTFAVSFNRFVNGAQQVVNVGTETVNSVGTYTVNDTFSVQSSAASSNSFDQVWIHNISSGQSDVYSNKVSFSVTCATPAPPPTLPPPPPVPTSLGNTNDPQVCTAHAGLGGGLACSAGFSNHWLALVWTCNNCRADGYRLYRVDGGQHTLVPPRGDAYSKDPTITLAVLPVPSGGFQGFCYTVTAYKGSSESNDSNAYCVNGPIDTPIVRSFNLVPNNTRVVYHHHSYSFPAPGCGLPNNGLGQAPGLTVGFIHDFCSSLGVTGYSDTMIYQSALSFDLGSAGILLRNSKASVKSATLTFQRDDGSNSSCLGAVHLPTGDWSNAQDLIPNNDYISGIPWSSNDVTAAGPINGHVVLIAGGKYSIDVASAIQGFAKGTIPDYGFLLMGGNETRETSDNNTCATGYGSFGLNVQVLIQP